MKEDKSWLDYRNHFSDMYDTYNYESKLQSKVMNASHNFLERKFTHEDCFDTVLEVGSGTGKHIPFVRHRYNQYFLTDIDKKALDVAKTNINDSISEKLVFKQVSAEDLDFPDNCFDRVIAAHVLEHLYKPHLILKEWARVIKKNGILSVLIPTDPGIAWRFGRHLGPRKKALANGIAYDYVMAREQVNSCTNLIALLKHYFPNFDESWWPLSIPSIDLNLFYSFHARVSNVRLENCS
jgi:phosphatidylethanolamine/phosphatidyl-N-methylethanolamine N-methyltransferase